MVIVLSPRGVLHRIHMKKYVPDSLFSEAEAWNLIKKETLAQLLSCKFCEIVKATVSFRTPPLAASLMRFVFAAGETLHSKPKGSYFIKRCLITNSLKIVNHLSKMRLSITPLLWVFLSAFKFVFFKV